MSTAAGRRELTQPPTPAVPEVGSFPQPTPSQTIYPPSSSLSPYCTVLETKPQNHLKLPGRLVQRSHGRESRCPLRPAIGRHSERGRRQKSVRVIQIRVVQ